ncbi:hypothetical protein [Oceanobacter kriegii]|uniref:hypothetical protein n=1 Tax=Oceanobacter kriegii TaxID=64972 RepID=UPI00055BC46F|nr:hypothetical protein [Oceanobacter kriegii]
MECSILDFGCHADAFLTLLHDMFLGFYSALLLGVVAVFAAIPYPDFLDSDVQLPAAIMYGADMFMLETGAQIIVTAYLTRFIIRRIPVIG